MECTKWLVETVKFDIKNSCQKMFLVKSMQPKMKKKDVTVAIWCEMNSKIIVYRTSISNGVSRTDMGKRHQFITMEIYQAEMRSAACSRLFLLLFKINVCCFFSFSLFLSFTGSTFSDDEIDCMAFRIPTVWSSDNVQLVMSIYCW